MKKSLFTAAFAVLLCVFLLTSCKLGENAQNEKTGSDTDNTASEYVSDETQEEDGNVTENSEENNSVAFEGKKAESGGEKNTSSSSSVSSKTSSSSGSSKASASSKTSVSSDAPSSSKSSSSGKSSNSSASSGNGDVSIDESLNGEWI